MENLKEKIKKHKKIILFIFTAVFGGLLLYCMTDIWFTGLFHESRHYPYRLPFERISCCISFITACPLFLSLISEIIASANTVTKKIIHCIGILAMLVVCSFILGIAWGNIFEFLAEKEISSYFELFVEYIL